MHRRHLFCVLLVVLTLTASPQHAFSWSKGHRLIRLWAVARLPKWQRDLLGSRALSRLCKEYTSLQDRHAGGKAPELDPYCVVPGVRLSLHDVNPAGPSAKATLWYMDRIREELKSGETDEAMKFLGVLCHWNEDPGSPGAHSSPISEWQLKTLIPPPKQKQRFNYLFGAGGIMDTGDYKIPDVRNCSAERGRKPPFGFCNINGSCNGVPVPASSRSFRTRCMATAGKPWSITPKQHSTMPDTPRT